MNTNYSNYLGKRFGKLVAINKTGKRRNQRIVWLCQCDCGNQCETSSEYLQRGSAKTCGCKYKLSIPKAAVKIIICAYKKQSKNRNINYSLTEEEFEKFICEPCYYCGITGFNRLKFRKTRTGKYNGTYNYNGIDRIDPNIGYIKENCVTCCAICNKMKSSLSYKEFIDHIKKISINLNE